MMENKTKNQIHSSHIIVKVKDSNMILISQKKAEEDVKKKKYENNIHTLMQYISRILTNDKISDLSYEVIYTLCYNICIEKGAEQLTRSFTACIESHLSLLFNQCCSFLDLNEFSFFRKIVDVFNDYIGKILIIQKTFMYYENNYLFKKSLPNIKHQSKEIFFKIFFVEKILNRVVSFVFENIEHDRNGIYVDKVLISDIVRMLSQVHEDAYTALERKLISQTTEYYQNEYIKHIENKNCLEYSLYIHERLISEEQRIADFSLSKSRDKIIRALSQEAIEKFMEDDSKILPHITSMITKFQVYNLKVLKNISNEFLIDKFYDKFAKSIELYGMDIIAQNINSLINQNQIKSAATDDSCANLINCLLEFLEKLDVMKKELDCLSSKPHLSLISNKIFSFINSPFQNYHLLLPKLLPRYIDFTFKKNFRMKSSTQNLASDVDKIFNLFKYLRDKDVFELNHRKYLSYRLLNNFFYEEMELKLLGKLKLECGAIFTHRCEIMISDVKNSCSMMDGYRNSKYYHKSLNCSSMLNQIDFNTKVLTMGNWIVNINESVTMKDMEANTLFKDSLPYVEILSNFGKYYNMTHPNVILSHNFFLGSCEVYANVNKKYYTLILTPFQAMFCSLFNKNKTYSFSSIEEIFGIKDTSAMVTSILPLIKVSLFTCSNENELVQILSNKNRDTKPMDKTILFSFNSNFVSKQARMSFNANLKFKSLESSLALTPGKQEDSIVFERKYAIDSNIIRIMKSKGTYSHLDLIQDVVVALNGNFHPDLQDIKYRIESLIERGYLKRRENNYNTYIYIA